MINRILNAEDDEQQRNGWIRLLELAATHARAAEWVKESARHFLELQQAR
jgi:hypothetical protein